ncbi:MAG: hypothetical protein P8X96_25635, partial [Desulfobacteraceae bacterium]
MDPALFARKALNGIAKNKTVIMLPKIYHLFGGSTVYFHHWPGFSDNGHFIASKSSLASSKLLSFGWRQTPPIIDGAEPFQQL